MWKSLLELSELDTCSLLFNSRKCIVNEFLFAQIKVNEDKISDLSYLYQYKSPNLLFREETILYIQNFERILNFLNDRNKFLKKIFVILDTLFTYCNVTLHLNRLLNIIQFYNK